MAASAAKGKGEPKVLAGGPPAGEGKGACGGEVPGGEEVASGEVALVILEAANSNAGAGKGEGGSKDGPPAGELVILDAN